MVTPSFVFGSFDSAWHAPSPRPPEPAFHGLSQPLFRKMKDFRVDDVRTEDLTTPNAVEECMPASVDDKCRVGERNVINSIEWYTFLVFVFVFFVFVLLVACLCFDLFGFSFSVG